MMALSNFLTINKNNTVEALTSEVGPSTGDIMKSRKQGSKTRESKTSTWKKPRMRRVLRHGYCAFPVLRSNRLTANVICA